MGGRDLPSLYVGMAVGMAVELSPLISVNGMRGVVSMMFTPLFRPRKPAKNRIPFENRPHDHWIAQVCQKPTGRSKKHRA